MFCVVALNTKSPAGIDLVGAKFFCPPEYKPTPCPTGSKKKTSLKNSIAKKS